MIDNKQKYFFRPTIPTNEHLKYINNNDEEENNNITPKKEENKNNKVRNILLGSLMALASISIPTIEYLDKPQKGEIDYQQSSETEKAKIMCNPELIAKGGDNDSIIEIPEFLSLLNFSGMENLPQSTQSSIKMIASANYQPIIISDEKAKEKLINQIEKIQKMVDYSIANNIKNPSKTYEQKILEYKAKYISPTDIVDQVDFSEIANYKDDLSLLKVKLRNCVNPILRKDNDSNEKFTESVNKLQKIVDQTVQQCKTYGKIAGNKDYNSNLSTSELTNLLNQESLEGIEKGEQKIIIDKATKSYKPISFDNIQDNHSIKEKNKQIGIEVQKAQNILDSEALKYKLSHLEE